MEKARPKETPVTDDAEAVREYVESALPGVRLGPGRALVKS